jgi:hypothetical protein
MRTRSMSAPRDVLAQFSRGPRDPFVVDCQVFVGGHFTRQDADDHEHTCKHAERKERCRVPRPADCTPMITNSAR